MRSIDLLQDLRKVPTIECQRSMSFRDMVTGLAGTDRAMFAAEFTSTVSVSLWAVFERVNVDDRLAKAYEAQYPNSASGQSLYDQWQEMVERGPESVQGFVSGLKGKVAELHTKDLLEDRGYTNVMLASDPTQEVWDISAIKPDGQEVLISVKSYGSESASKVQALMEANPAIEYNVSTEVYDKIYGQSPDLADRLTDIGSTEKLEGGTREGLNLLTQNMGIDIPDGVVDIMPYATVIAGGVRLIYSVLQTERKFRAADRSTKNRIQVVQTLTLMSRMGVSTVLATAGGMGGASVGSLVPGVGNAVAGIGGTIIGAGMGMYLNRRLQPQMLNIALGITGLTHDDLFYYKNKQRIDDVAAAFQDRAGRLAAVPGF